MSEAVEIAVKLSGLELVIAKTKAANYHAQKLEKLLGEIKEARKELKLIS